MNGECAIVDDLPILQPNGLPTTIQVQEDTPPAGVFVTGITYTGQGSETGNNPCGRTHTYLLGPNVNISTFTNQKGVVPICGG